MQDRGDFYAEVSYELIDWTSQNGIRFGMTMTSQNGSQLSVERVNFGANEFSTQDVYLLDWGGGWTDEYLAGDSLTGKLRMKREDSRVSGFYFDDGDWILMDGRSRTTDPVTLRLASWAHNDNETGLNIIVAFDDFILSQGELDCEP